MTDTQELDLTYLADTLRWIRETHKLTQQNVADLCGLTTRTIEKLESGKHPPSEQTLRSLSRGLGYQQRVFYKPTPAQQEQFRRDLLRSVRTTLLVRTTIARTGKDFLAFVGGFDGLNVTHNEVAEGVPLETALALFELTTDWGDLWGDIGLSGQLGAAKNLAETADRLAVLGYVVLVGRHKQMQRYKNGPPLVAKVGLMAVRPHQTAATENFALIKLEDGWEVLPEDRVQLPEEWLSGGATH